MNRMKFLLATLCCLFVIGNARAQFSTGGVNNLTVVFDGYNGWAPTTYSNIFTFRINTNSNTLVHTFYSAGSWNFQTSNSFGAISIVIGNNWGVNTTYSDYFNNSMVIGQQYSHWIDDWDNKNWYLYSMKTAPNVWHWWIAN